MSQIKLNQMADIFLPLEAQPLLAPWLQVILIIAGGLIFILLCITLWRYFTDPFGRLERQIRQKKLSSRTAAHQLGHLLNEKYRHSDAWPGCEFQQAINQLRFQRHKPEMHQLLSLLKQVKHEH